MDPYHHSRNPPLKKMIMQQQKGGKRQETSKRAVQYGLYRESDVDFIGLSRWADHQPHLVTYPAEGNSAACCPVSPPSSFLLLLLLLALLLLCSYCILLGFFCICWTSVL